MPPPTGVVLRQRKSGSLPLTRNCSISPKKRTKGQSFSRRSTLFFTRLAGGMSILVFTLYSLLKHKDTIHSSGYKENDEYRNSVEETSTPLFRGKRTKLHSQKNHHFKDYNTIMKLFKRESFVEPLHNEDLAIKTDKLPVATYRCSNGNIVPLNDNYCDCPEGGDESLTSACSHLTAQVQIFDCKDGRKKIFSSHVRDGFQDCDDGSDELIPVV